MDAQRIETEVAEILDSPRRCECCDHPLQHAIRNALATYDNAVPPLRVGAVMQQLEDALTAWEDSL